MPPGAVPSQLPDARERLAMRTTPPQQELRSTALDLLQEADAARKAHAVREAWQKRCAEPTSWTLDTTRVFEEPTLLPGRPERPQLVGAQQVPARSAQTPAGRAALLHAIAHIEFNAINLALDAVWRFADQPGAFYIDWWRVAAEEALHFSLLCEHLRSLGHEYGDFDAHDGLWTMCHRTRGDLLARMALVPRTLEARGLDATPLIQAKLGAAGDRRAVEILDLVLRDEVGHVAIGNRWFHHLCTQQGIDATTLYPQLVARYQAPRLKPPFNLQARRAAGFTEAELIWLTQADG